MDNPFIIIVEDDPKLGVIYETALREAGFQTFLDPRGDQFMDKLTTPNLCLVILDLHLPYISGVEALKNIRNTPVGENLPIIVLTADFIQAKTISHLTEHILIKPVSLTRLLKLINSLLVSDVK
jgi:DNA-binding response OmpR family regulator